MIRIIFILFLVFSFNVYGQEKDLEIFVLMPDYEKLENVDESKVYFNAVKADRRFINDINNDNYDQLIYEYFDDVDSYMERFPQSYNAIDYQDRDSLPNIEPDPKDSRVMFKMIDGVDPQIYIEFAKKHNKKELYMIPEKAPQKGKKTCYLQGRSFYYNGNSLSKCSCS